jgi:hypothetical protein
MKRTGLTLVMVVALVLGLRAGFGSRASARTDPEHLTPLVSLEDRDGLAIGGITIEGLPQGDRFIYVRANSQWTCPTVYGAIGTSQEIEAFLSEVILAWGERVAGTDRRADYGFDVERPLRVTLHGPKMATDPERDIVLEIELGMSLPGLGEGRGYLRRVDGEDLFEIDQNPRKRLRPAEESQKVPPLLDERLLAGEFPTLGEGIERAFVDWSDGRSLEVRSRVLGPPPDRNSPPPREWVAMEGEDTARILPYRIGGWQSLLYRVNYEGLADPKIAERRGLDEPSATITLLQVGGDAIELVVGRRAPSGQAFVLNRKTNMLCLLASEDVELLLPTVPWLCSGDIANPWEAWLPK